MQNNKIAIFILFIIFLGCEKTPENNDPKWENDKINAIVVDKNNTQWIATDIGLFKSSDDEYIYVPLSVSEKVYSLFYEETENTLWISTETNLLKATINSDGISESIIDSENLSHNLINTFHIDADSKRWFGGEEGFSLFYDNTWKKDNFRINSQGSLFNMSIEEYPINSIASWDGDYFFATRGAKLYRAFDYDEEVDAFTGATQWDPPYNGLSITDTMFVVFVDKEERKWMGGTEGIQMHIGHNPKDAASTFYVHDELPDLHALCINQAPNGDIWVGTRKGLAVFDETNWEIITENLPDLYITAIAFDKDGNAIIGTKGGLVILE